MLRRLNHKSNNIHDTIMRYEAYRVTIGENRLKFSNYRLFYNFVQKVYASEFTPCF